MKFVPKILIVAILSMSQVSLAQNGTFPTLIAIADKATNSTVRIANVLEDTKSNLLPKIVDELVLLGEQAKRSADLAEKISSHGYIALGTFIIVSIAVSIGGFFVGCRHLINKYFIKQGT